MNTEIEDGDVDDEESEAANSAALEAAEAELSRLGRASWVRYGWAAIHPRLAGALEVIGPGALAVALVATPFPWGAHVPAATAALVLLGIVVALVGLLRAERRWGLRKRGAQTRGLFPSALPYLVAEVRAKPRAERLALVAVKDEVVAEIDRGGDHGRLLVGLGAAVGAVWLFPSWGVALGGLTVEDLAALTARGALPGIALAMWYAYYPGKQASVRRIKKLVRAAKSG